MTLKERLRGGWIRETCLARSQRLWPLLHSLLSNCCSGDARYGGFSLVCRDHKKFTCNYFISFQAIELAQG